MLYVVKNQRFIKKVKNFFHYSPKNTLFFHAKTAPAAKFLISGNID